MKIRQNQIKLVGIICALSLSACSNQVEITDESLSSQVILASIGVSERDVTSNAPNGTYYFGWTSKQGGVYYTPVQVSGSGNIGKIDTYWNNIMMTNVTFSNTLDIKEEDNQTVPIDILWGKKDISAIERLNFTLTHQMAKTHIDLTAPSWTIKSITLSDLKKQYSFSNTSGDVTAVKESGNIEFEAGNTDKILPPQDKGNESELIVVVTNNNDNNKEHTFRRRLPYAMAVELSNQQWEDTPLRFDAGHTLVISAAIPESPNDEIQFTYATLKEWNIKNGGTASARPAGLYTVADWNAFAAAYNNNNQTLLKKYGTYADKWTFTVQRTIDMTNEASLTVINNFQDNLTAKANCYIITGDKKLGNNITGDFIKETIDIK